MSVYRPVSLLRSSLVGEFAQEDLVDLMTPTHPCIGAQKRRR